MKICGTIELLRVELCSSNLQGQGLFLHARPERVDIFTGIENKIEDYRNSVLIFFKWYNASPYEVDESRVRITIERSNSAIEDFSNVSLISFKDNSEEWRCFHSGIDDTSENYLAATEYIAAVYDNIAIECRLHTKLNLT